MGLLLIFKEGKPLKTSGFVAMDGSVVVWVSSKIFSNNLTKRDLLFLQKPTLNRPMIHPKPTFKTDKSKQKVALIIGNIFRCTKYACLNKMLHKGGFIYYSSSSLGLCYYYHSYRC